MEWMNRGSGQVQQSGQTVRPTDLSNANANATAPAQASKKKTGLKSIKSIKTLQVAFLFVATALVVGVILLLGLGDGRSREASYVDKTRLQAVFLNGGQVYFGNIKDLNGKFLTMGNIYYLRVNQQVQPNQQTTNSSNDISLVKLGCELHGPTDTMVINREQVVFWENLKSDGQVAKAVEQYKSSNKGEQKCETSTQSPAGTGTNIQENSKATTESKATTPSSSTPTTTPATNTPATTPTTTPARR